jgi:hypothetical protein
MAFCDLEASSMEMLRLLCAELLFLARRAYPDPSALRLVLMR